MQRTKFPYTAKSSAKVIRHAVAIDERRAKFRQDLISGERHIDHQNHHNHLHLHLHHHKHENGNGTDGEDKKPLVQTPPVHQTQAPRFQPQSRRVGISLGIPDARPGQGSASPGLSSRASQSSLNSYMNAAEREDDRELEEDEKAPQDIQEVWFPGLLPEFSFLSVPD